ncbi:hypothetical protein F4811DRAFT_504312 [Daldinia bambusicola]|nr:hypothetical protein F4811DRAFT_504312 [Daldinia bambusicola]
MYCYVLLCIVIDFWTTCSLPGIQIWRGWSRTNDLVRQRSSCKCAYVLSLSYPREANHRSGRPLGASIVHFG